MTDWLPLAPVFLLTIALLWGPGSLIAWGLGLRGLLLLGVAPAVTTAVLATAAIAGPLVGLSWSVLLWGGATVVAAVLALLVSWAGGVYRRPRPSRRSGLSLYVAMAVILAGGFASLLLQTRRMLRAIGGPGMIAQTYDTSYHLNAVMLMQETRDASSLHMTLTAPDRTSSFYPAAWHDVVLTVTDLTGAGVVEATNIVAVVVSVLVWPAAVLALVRVVAGPRPLLLALTALAATLFPQYPNLLVHFGVLYPNLLSYAFVPVALALLVELVRRRGRGHLVPLVGLGAVMVAITLAQPNGVFAVVFLGLPVVLVAMARWSRRSWARSRARASVVAAWTGTLVAAALVWASLDSIEMIANMREGIFWQPVGTLRQALWNVASLSAAHPTGQPQILLAVAVAVGFVVALRVPAWRWLPLSYAVTAALYVVAQAGEEPHRSDWTGFWYTDPHRLAALLPMIGVPLAAFGAWRAAQRARAAIVRAERRRRASDGRSPRYLNSVPITFAVTLAVACLATFALSRQIPLRDSFQAMTDVYSPDATASESEELLSQEEYVLLEQLDDIVPPEVTVVGNPWDGSTMAWAVGGRETIFPHPGMTPSGDREIIAQRLNDALTDPAVCKAVNDLDVGYVLRMGKPLWGYGADVRATRYPGLRGLEEDGVAEVVAEVGSAELLRITACGETGTS